MIKMELVQSPNEDGFVRIEDDSDRGYVEVYKRDRKFRVVVNDQEKIIEPIREE